MAGSRYRLENVVTATPQGCSQEKRSCLVMGLKSVACILGTKMFFTMTMRSRVQYQCLLERRETWLLLLLRTTRLLRNYFDVLITAILLWGHNAIWTCVYGCDFLPCFLTVLKYGLAVVTKRWENPWIFMPQKVTHYEVSQHSISTLYNTDRKWTSFKRHTRVGWAPAAVPNAVVT